MMNVFQKGKKPIVSYLFILPDIFSIFLSIGAFRVQRSALNVNGIKLELKGFNHKKIG